MVYLIQVGYNSRRSAFIKMHEKVISVEGDIAYHEVKRHFKDKYEGFEVIVKAVKAEPIIGDIEHHAIDDDEGKQFPQSFETRCLKFPVKADLFIQAAKDCNNSVPESAPPAEPKTTPEDEPFLPDSVLDTEITSLGAAETETPALPIESAPDTEVAGNNTTAYAADDIPF